VTLSLFYRSLSFSFPQITILTLIDYSGLA
jgi:hypothetical protein